MEGWYEGRHRSAHWPRPLSASRERVDRQPEPDAEPGLLRLKQLLLPSPVVIRSTLTAGLVLFMLSCGTKELAGPVPSRPTLPQTYRASGHMAAGDVVV